MENEQDKGTSQTLNRMIEMCHALKEVDQVLAKYKMRVYPESECCLHFESDGSAGIRVKIYIARIDATPSL
jgi:hypothetical protein